MRDRLLDARGLKSRRQLKTLIKVASALAWGALALSVWGVIEHARARKLRHRISNRLLAQVFPRGRPG